MLADFTDDDAATARLLKVADRPSEWSFQLAKEQKRKAWLENLPRLTAELQGAGVDIIDRPAGETWQWTDWRVAYQPMTVADAVADGWSAICDESDPEITWVKERTKPSPYTAPERTPEQLAAEVREQELTRGLATAAEVRTKFIKDLIQKPAADKTKGLLLDFIVDRLSLGDIAPWLGIDHEDIDEQEVIDAIGKLGVDQLVALLHVDSFEREMYMRDLAAWSDTASRWASTDTWRERLQNVYGYEWTDAEQAALAYHQAKAAAADA